jgi:hypothetical protein
MKSMRARRRPARRGRRKVLLLAVATGVFCCSAFVAAGSASASIAPHLVEEFDHAEGTPRPIVDETHAGLEGLQHATYSPATAFDTQERLHQVTEDFASDLSTADGEATQAAEVSDSGDALDKCMKGALWMIAWDAAWDKYVAHQDFSMGQEVYNTETRVVSCLEDAGATPDQAEIIQGYLMDAFKEAALQALGVDDSTIAFLDWTRITANS